MEEGGGTQPESDLCLQPRDSVLHLLCADVNDYTRCEAVETGSGGLLTRWQIINDGVQCKCNSSNSEIKTFTCKTIFCHWTNKPPVFKLEIPMEKFPAASKVVFCSGFPQDPKSIFWARTSSVLRHVQGRNRSSPSRNEVLRFPLPKNYCQVSWWLAAILEGLQESTVPVHLPSSFPYLCRTSLPLGKMFFQLKGDRYRGS